MKTQLGTKSLLAGVTGLFFFTDASAATLDISLQQLDRSLKNGVLGTIDLTMGGLALDWLKPVASDLTSAEKDAASLLTLAPQGASFTPGNYADDGYTFAWSGGDSSDVSGSSFQGSNNTGASQNVGFRVTYTAVDAGPFTLIWYSAANNTQNWRLTGSLGAATDFQQAGTNVGATGGDGSVDEFFWTVTGNADAAGQVLTLDLLNSTTTNSAIAVTGVTVVPEPSAALFLGITALGGGFIRHRRAR
jgi:hypothetical protein